jgi:hypothetical protein
VTQIVTPSIEFTRSYFKHMTGCNDRCVAESAEYTERLFEMLLAELRVHSARPASLLLHSALDNELMN